MKVIALRSVIDYLNNLVLLLYENGYFGFKESAKKYVIDLFTEIKTNLPTMLHKPAPKYFDKYGKNMEYAVFRKNKHTSWYVFFRIYNKDGEDIYQVRYIANNHTIAQYL
jgi:histone deacetylase complex regulatory component SIN3